MDVVRICYLDLTEQPIPATKLTVGRKWLLEDDLIASFRSIRDGNLTFWDWFRSLRGVSEVHWFAKDDIKPFLKWFSKFLRTIYRGVFSYFR